MTVDTHPRTMAARLRAQLAAQGTDISRIVSCPRPHRCGHANMHLSS
jgi:hypothetical protein